MLISFKNVNLNLGNTVLLDQVNFTLEPGERLCLVGRNGTGKSTLMKVLTGEVAIDSGELVRSQGLRITELPQDVPAGIEGSVFEVVADGLGKAGRLVAQYHHLLIHEPENMDKLGKVQTALEALDGWTIDSKVQAMCERLQLPPDTEFADLSGGLKRRALLARALVAEPDILLLDEPTNHLDIDSITWLEEFLATWPGTLLFITHDRAFLRRLATRIIELDRGILRSWPGTYDEYLVRKEESLRIEEQSNALFDKRLAQEEVWIRKGIKARRVRDQGRVERLKKLRNEYAARRELSGEAKLVLQEAEKSGKLVAEAKGISFSRGDRIIVKNFSTTIIRGDKIGIIGPNGAGKTTLLNLLLAKLEPDSGTVRNGSKLEVAYFDQLRAQLDDSKPVFENIGGGKDFVTIDGKQLHVMSYLQQFLFTPDRARSPVKALSGGERARLLLARLFAEPSNLLVLDEPTNDLDVETLDLLEELLIDYQGTVLMVSHDRAFLNNVVTRTFVYEGGGRIGEYVGGYEDWLRQRKDVSFTAVRPEPKKVEAVKVEAPKPVAAAAAPALNSKEKRELENLPKQIEKLETEQRELGLKLSDPKFFQTQREQALATQARLAIIDQDLVKAYARWEQLEALRG
ncbi:ATP-binding cassette domain-containing protein [Nevskia ramosa]|uniref:ATP-binding cassette domain-containing protein n=1 Tax=Nevskia ramosa TaxID=64002 RepID=UPI0003B60D86|nr:ATP-binding cassette domain-containing protein [Nevskia ramosa]